jgi:Family of unknown function (DUF6519)
MGADLSRIRSNPLRDYAAVQLQQGRVLLDADFNEAVDVIDRRLRATASDVLGRSTVAQTTPDAFKMTVIAAGLSIGQGRLYVDGLLAENHGATSALPAERRFDPLLAEPAFSSNIAYASQPYLPDPPALPTGGRHLVYLDVFNREITALEQPDLVETALAVDTTTRQQTVWQVRVLDAEAGSASCASPDADLAGWVALIAPSSGRLSTGTYEVPPSADPCQLPPSGGYRGLENQTYRVEIHEGGQPGTGATFKWSRDNASVGSGVASVVSATELELHTLGRDDVLRFNTGDWVEITDDVRELSQRAGELRRITVNEAARRISFAPGLPAGLVMDSTQARARHLRVRRWDQAHTVLRATGGGNTAVHQDLDATATAAINVPAAGTTLLLENGITVSFASVGSKGFKAGDFWVFAARTADASVEVLEQAPPRGTHHHYARLGLWDVAAGNVTDCRTLWPPRGEGHDCSCTECITPQSHASGQLTIQAAVDRLRDTGGSVCLSAGSYALDKPVLISGARALRIKGQGAATLVTTPGTAFGIANSLGLAIEDLAIVSAGQTSSGLASAIAVRTVVGLALQRLVIVVVSSGEQASAAITLSGVVLGATVADNTILAPLGIRSGAGEPLAAGAANAAPIQTLLTAALRIENNLLWCERSGVVLAGRALHAMGTRITGNELLGCRNGGVVMSGATLPGASVHIEGNSAKVSGPGIVAGVGGLWISDNKLVAAPQANSQALNGAGITLRTGLNPKGSEACHILANQISGFEDAGVLIAMPVRSLVIKLNTVQFCGNGIVSEGDAQSQTAAIENNRLSDIGLGGKAAAPLTHGIGVHRVGAVALVGNSVQRVGTAPSAATLCAGIVSLGVHRLIASGNQVFDIAPPTAERSAGAGIVLLAPFSHAEVQHNQVDRESLPAFDGGGEWVALLADGVGDDRGVTRIGGYTSVRVDAASTLVFGFTAFGDASRAETPLRAWLQRHTAFAAAEPAGVGLGAGVGGISVLGNALGGRGQRAVVRLAVTTDCLFNDNRCELRGSANKKVAAVELDAQTTIVNANRVRGGQPSIALRGNDDGQRLTVLGNITTGGIDGMPKEPWERLNVRG